MTTLTRVSLLLLFFAVSSACSTPTRYLIAAPQVSQSPTALAGRFARIGLKEVSLPHYAQNDKITSRHGGNFITQDEDHRWAEPPEKAVIRGLVSGLEARLGSSVIAEPFPRGLNPNLQIDVRFDQFVRNTQTNSAQVAGQFVLISGDGRTVAAIQRFNVSTALESGSYSDFASALQRSMHEVVEQIADAAGRLPAAY